VAPTSPCVCPDAASAGRWAARGSNLRVGTRSATNAAREDTCYRWLQAAKPCQTFYGAFFVKARATGPISLLHAQFTFSIWKAPFPRTGESRVRAGTVKDGASSATREGFSLDGSGVRKRIAFQPEIWLRSTAYAKTAGSRCRASRTRLSVTSVTVPSR
jgi:hypothetical protein